MTEHANPAPRDDMGPALVMQPDAGEQFWLPKSGGVCSINISPANFPANMVAFGTHELPVGGATPPAGYERGDVLYFVQEGVGQAELDGKAHDIAKYSTILVGRRTRHRLINRGETPLIFTWTNLPPGPERLIRKIAKPKKAGDREPPEFNDTEIAQAENLTDWYGGPKELNGLRHAKGLSLVVDPEEGPSYWQAEPTGGYITVKISPYNYPSNLFAFGIQQVGPGGVLPTHSHSRNEELKYIVDGTGSATVNGTTARIGPGTTVFTGRWVDHGFQADEDAPLTLSWLMFPPGLENVLTGIGRPRRPGETQHPGAFDLPENLMDLLDEAGFGPVSL